MEEKDDLQTMIDKDILYCEEVWKKSSYDKEKMEKLFRSLLHRYGKKIQGFDREMLVISSYENSSKMAENYRENVKKLWKRLEDFRDNGYQNEGLEEFYIRAEKDEISFRVDFSQVRIEIGMMEALSPLEKEEIMVHLSQMEDICARPLPRSKRWEMLRGHMFWLSGKDVAVVMKILVLFLKINE